MTTPRARGDNDSMPTEQELLARIEQLEAQNSALQDKLDMIWSVLAEDTEVIEESGEDGGEGNKLVQIDRKIQ